MKISIQGCSAVVFSAWLLAAPSLAQAATLNLFDYGQAGTPPNGHVWTLNLTVDEAADKARFTFTKTRGGQGYGLTDIYFESGLVSVLTGTLAVSAPVNTNQVDVAFMSGAGTLPAPDEDPLVPGVGNPWHGNLAHFFSFETTFPRGNGNATATAQDNSLDRNGESVTITWSYAGTESALLALLLDGNGASRIAVRVNQNAGNGVCPTSGCGLSTIQPVPVPAAAWLLVSALLGLGGVSPRRA
jgi:hypothetical protein